MKSKAILGLTLFCLLSSAAFVLAETGDVSAADETDEMKTYHVYASVFTFSEPNDLYRVKWEIYFDNPNPPSAEVQEEHIGAVFHYSYPHYEGTFYVKEYISDDMDFDPSRTRTAVSKFVVEGLAPVVTIIHDDEILVEVRLPYDVVDGPQVFNENKVPGFKDVQLFRDAEHMKPFGEQQVVEDITLYAYIPEFDARPGDSEATPSNTLVYALATMLVVLAIILLIVALRRRNEETD